MVLFFMKLHIFLNGVESGVCCSQIQFFLFKQLPRLFNLRTQVLVVLLQKPQLVQNVHLLVILINHQLLLQTQLQLQFLQLLNQFRVLPHDHALSHLLSDHCGFAFNPDLYDSEITV